MAINNDQRILELRRLISDKKEKLVITRFAPVTNCSLELDGERHNLHIQNANKLTWLLIKLNCYQMSIKDLKLGKYEISGYPVGDWINDIKMKLRIIAQKNEEDNLKVLENKLNKLLSEDKKTELELDSIAELLL